MQPSIETPSVTKEKWVYVSLRVRDGDRILKPGSVGPDAIWFSEPPHLTGTEIEVIIANGGVEHRQFVTVLPHDAEETQIPIRLTPAPAK
jgi:hypothetical protein